MQGAGWKNEERRGGHRGLETARLPKMGPKFDFHCIYAWNRKGGKVLNVGLLLVLAMVGQQAIGRDASTLGTKSLKKKKCPLCSFCATFVSSFSHAVL